MDGIASCFLLWSDLFLRPIGIIPELTGESDLALYLRWIQAFIGD